MQKKFFILNCDPIHIFEIGIQANTYAVLCSIFLAADVNLRIRSAQVATCTAKIKKTVTERTSYGSWLAVHRFPHTL
jgi:hypothetical protein